MKMRRRLNVIQSIRFSPEDYETICRAAEFHGATVSAYMRDVVLAAANRPQIKASSTMYAVASYR